MIVSSRQPACLLVAGAVALALQFVPVRGTAAHDHGSETDPSTTPLVISDDAIRGVLVTGPEAPAQPSSERLHAVTRAAPGQDIDVVGHIESVDEDSIVVLGRRVELGYASEVDGGGWQDVVPPALVRVQGKGQLDGSIEAVKVTVQRPRDAVVEARIREITTDFRKDYFSEAEVLDDPAIDYYINRIGRGLLPGYLPEEERAFTFIVVVDPTPNAFALPDGTVVLHTGMLARVNNEAQLASVLAHELAHVTQRHYIRSLEHQTKQQLAAIGAQIAQIALGVVGKPEEARAVGLITSGMLSRYSRSFEDEADIVGLRYLFLAGYDVRQAPEVWETFRQFYGEQSPVDNYFYGSHSTATARLGNLGFEIRKAYEPSGLTGGSVNTVAFLKAVAPAIRENAEAEAKARWWAWAEKDMRKAAAADPDDAETYIALGDFLWKRHGKSGLIDALGAYQHAAEVAPDDAEAQRALGKALLAAGHVEQARDHLERALALKPKAKWAGKVRATLARL